MTARLVGVCTGCGAGFEVPQPQPAILSLCPFCGRDLRLHLEPLPK